MTIAQTTDYWTSRFNGTDPTVSENLNEGFTATGSGGVVSGDYWKVTDQILTITPTTNAYTLLACFYYNTAPANGHVIMKLDNGSASVEVQVNNNKFDLVGATTVSTIDLNPADTSEVPVILRLTLTGTTAKLYVREIVTDLEGADHFISVTGSASSSRKIQWGNTDGDIMWGNVYATTDGAFSPEEMSPSAWTSDTLLRLGLSMVEQLKNSKRLYLKNYVDDSSIVYGYDLSSEMVSRIRPPSIHIVIQNISSPETLSLGGAIADLSYTLSVFITTQAADYKESYILGSEIAGEVFDELYTQTGLNGTTDAIDTFNATLDTRRDSDEVICVHQLVFVYRRRTNLRKR